VTVGAPVALDADGAHVRQQHHGTLPDLAVESRRCQLLPHDRVGGPQRLQPVRGHLTDDPDTEPGARERLPVHDLLRQAEFEADGAHLVLEQGAQRLDELELQVVRQPADVVMALDRRRPGAPAGLHDVRVERALHEEAHLLARGARLVDDLAGGLLEDADELASDDLPLLLRVHDAGECVEEPLRGVHHLELHAGGRDEVALDLLRLARPQQAVVDEDARQPVPDRALHERSGDG